MMLELLEYLSIVTLALLVVVYFTEWLSGR